MLNTTTNSPNETKERGHASSPISAEDAHYGILVTSIGTAGASIIPALKMASSLPEQILAFRLFQAPSMLFKSLTRPIASEAVKILRQAGVKCEVRHQDEPFAQGDSDHEAALVIRDVQQMSAVLESVMLLLGVPITQAKQIVCSTPAVLVGRISASTAEALKQRFAPFGVDVDVSYTPSATFDAFIGDVAASVRTQAVQLAQANGIDVIPSRDGDSGTIFATNVNREQAERLHSTLTRAGFPLIVVNRDFQRFDVRLEKAIPSSELTTFLVETAGMPERIVPKVLSRLPVVTHSSVNFAEMHGLIAKFGALGAVASGQLLSFQAYGLSIEKVGDMNASTMILRGIGGLSKEAAENALTRARRIEGPLSSTLARWLQHELKQVGTHSKVVAR